MKQALSLLRELRQLGCHDAHLFENDGRLHLTVGDHRLTFSVSDLDRDTTELVAEIANIARRTCNGCGGSLRSASDGSPFADYGVWPTIRGQYHSPVLADSCVWSFALCEHCIAKMFDGFKIPPKGLCLINYEPVRAWRQNSYDG